GIWRIRAADGTRSVADLARLTAVDPANGSTTTPDPAITPPPPTHGAGIGHTRWATHGHPTPENAHPHLDCTGRLALIHNGIIENHSELRADLVAEGHVMTSATDTEVMAHLIERHLAAGLDLTAATRATLRAVR